MTPRLQMTTVSRLAVRRILHFAQLKFFVLLGPTVGTLSAQVHIP